MSGLGSCPTGEHISHPQCGYIGCVDLMPWAKANRYRYHLEESYRAEDNMHVRGDGRWFVEILCKHGLIYPKGGNMLLAVANIGVCQAIEAIPDVTLRRIDHKAREFVFPLERVDEVAAVLKPRQRRTYSPEELERKRERLRLARERKKSLTQRGQTPPVTAETASEGKDQG
jgi:hypothetical protein